MREIFFEAKYEYNTKNNKREALVFFQRILYSDPCVYMDSDNTVFDMVEF